MKKGFYSTAVAVLLTISVFVLPLLNPGSTKDDNDSGSVDKAPAIITDTNKKPVPAPEVNVLKSDETVTFIVETDGKPLCDVVKASKGKYKTVSQLLRSKEAKQYIDPIRKNQAVIKAGIRKMLPDADLNNSYTYNAVICGFSVTAPYSTLQRLKGITGVKSVTLASVGKLVISEAEEDEPSEISLPEAEESGPEEKNEPETAEDEIFPSLALQFKDTGAESVYKQGYSGKGKLIAVIDDSFFTSHEAFSANTEEPKYSQEDISALTSAGSFNISENEAVYVNSKVVFAYDYACHDNDTFSSLSSHGTKVASVAAGNNGSTFKSGAYDSQLALMKVCGDDEEQVNDAVLLAAIDDTAKLSPDIVNISLGVPRLCVTAELFDRAIDSLSETGCHVIAAAGNYAENVDINEDYGIRASYTDYGTISYPSSLSSVTAVGASNSTAHYGNSIITDTNKVFEFAEISTAHNETSPLFADVTELTEYCYTDSYGSEDELKLFDIKDKIAVVKRGTITIDEKIKAAEKLRAAGILIISDEPLYISFTAEKRDIPAAAVSSSSLSWFSSHTQGKLRSSDKTDPYSSAKANAPAPFTSYGVSSDLRLKPDILSPGTELYCADNDTYSQITGTSASAAGISAATAILYEYIDNELSIDETEKHLTANALMMNNADRLKYNRKLYYTPRLQGAGKINLKNAVSAPAYITADGISPAVTLGDDPVGSYTFRLTVHSISDKDITLSLNNVTQTDKLIALDDEYYNTLTPVSLTEYTNAVFKQDDKEIKELILPAGESIDIEVDLTISPAAALAYMRMAPNGFYVDGYIEFKETESGRTMSVPYMGYCGSWEIAEIFDSTVYDSDEPPLISGSSLYAAAQVGNYYPGVQLGTDLDTGKKDEHGICIGRDTVMNYTDSPTAGTSFIIPDYYLLRDAADYTISIKDSSGKSIFSQKLGNISSFASGGYKAYTGLLQSFIADGLKNLFSTLKEGKYTYIVSASAVPYASSASPAQSVAYDFIVDNTVPSKPAANTYAKDGRIYLELSSSDANGIRGFTFYTASGGKNKYHYGDKLDDLIGSSYMNEDSYTLISKEYKDDTAVFTYDISYLYNQLKRVKLIAASINIDSLTELKIAVRAVDSAFNLSDTAIADSCVSGSLTYHLTDQNDKPVEGVTMALGETVQTSDKYGVLKFTSVLPNYYGVKLISVPENYSTEFKSEAVFTSLDKTDYSKSIRFVFSGEYPIEESDEEVSATPEEAVSRPEKRQSYFENDNSVFGLVFICVLIVIFCGSLILAKLTRKSKRKSAHAPDNN